jgi:hypothetical protein
MKNNGSETTVVTLTQVYDAKDIVYNIFMGFYSLLMPSMGAKCDYFHRISLFRGGGGGAILLTVKSDVMCRILWVSTSCNEVLKQKCHIKDK